MVDKDNSKKKIHKIDTSKKNRDDNAIPNKFQYQNFEIYEEKINGDAAIRLYNLIFKPPKDPEREKIIKEAIKLFPEPEKSTEIDIDLS